MKTISLTQGKIAIVDDADYDWLNRRKWYACKWRHIYYAISRGVSMHRLILNASRGVQVDHVNCDGLDNRRSNLRLCSNAENQRHQQLNRRNTSGYKGVSRRKRKSRKPYDSKIQVNKIDIHVGCYQTAEEAGRAYDKAALIYHGDFALTNEMLGRFNGSGYQSPGSP